MPFGEQFAHEASADISSCAGNEAAKAHSISLARNVP